MIFYGTSVCLQHNVVMICMVTDLTTSHRVDTMTVLKIFNPLGRVKFKGQHQAIGQNSNSSKW